MYKCTECGCEYEIKPDFCDCGNDVFKEEKEIIAEVPKQEQTEVKPAKIPPQKAFSSAKTDFISQKSKKTPIEPISVTIFIVCIILSFLVIFVWNPEPKNTHTDNISENNKQESLNKSIPSIDKLWNNTPPKKESKQSEQKIITPAPAKKEQKSVVKTEPKSVPAVKKTIQTKPKSTTVVKQKTSVQKTTKPQTTSKYNTKVKTSANTQTQQKQSTPQKQQPQTTTAPTQQNPQTVTLSQKTEQQVQKTNSAQEKQEFINYKVSLRNTIGRKIDFTKVIGDGSCTVAFQINSSGKLINRSFAKQSSNMTLNDAVYSAVMSTPKFNPPPSAYNNEVLRLNIKFQNGNFEITLQ